MRSNQGHVHWQLNEPAATQIRHGRKSTQHISLPLRFEDPVGEVDIEVMWSSTFHKLLFMLISQTEDIVFWGIKMYLRNRGYIRKLFRQAVGCDGVLSKAYKYALTCLAITLSISDNVGIFHLLICSSL